MKRIAPPLLQLTQLDAKGHLGVRFVAYGILFNVIEAIFNFRFIPEIRGLPTKSVLQSKAPRELGLFALCSEAQNMIPRSARKKTTFLANFAVIFLGKINHI